MALASSYLGAVLSSEFLLRATIFQAFWNPTPLRFWPGDSRRDFKLPRYRLLTQSAKLRELQTDERKEMQELVLRQPWCNFSRLRDCFSTLLSAVWQDLLQDLNVFLPPSDHSFLDTSINNPRCKLAVFKATNLDGVSIELKYPGLSAGFVSLTYSGPDPRFDDRHILKLMLRPAEIVTLPDSCLWGDRWTIPRIQKLQWVYKHYIHKDHTKYSCDALYRGIKDAVLERNPNALLTLAWIAAGVSRYGMGNSLLSTFELPQDIFRLAIPSLCEDVESADTVAITMFKILIRSHAEAMPQHDEGINLWATRLLSRSKHRAFGQWLIEFGTRSEDVPQSRTSYHGSQPAFERYFSDGRISYRRATDIVRKFCRIQGFKPHSFERDLAELNFCQRSVAILG